MTFEPEPRLTLTTAELVTALLLPLRLALRDQEEVLGHRAPSQRIANRIAPKQDDRVTPPLPPEDARQPLPYALPSRPAAPQAEPRARLVPTRVQVRQVGSEPAATEPRSPTAGRLRPLLADAASALSAGGTPPLAPSPGLPSLAVSPKPEHPSSAPSSEPQHPLPAPAAESAQAANEAPARATAEASRSGIGPLHASAPPRTAGFGGAAGAVEASASAFPPPQRLASTLAPVAAAPRATAPAAVPVMPPARPVADPRLELAAPLHALARPTAAGLDAASSAVPPPPLAERSAWWCLPRLPLAPARGEAPDLETAHPPRVLEPGPPSTALPSGVAWSASSDWSSFSSWSSPWPMASPRSIRPGAPSADPPERESAIPSGNTPTAQDPLDPLQLEAALVRVLLASAQRHGVDLDP